jgi:hypothetical protein
MTYALREARAPAVHALAAPIARVMARMALAALRLAGDPVHDSVHAVPGAVITESNRAWKPGPAEPSFGLVTSCQRPTQEDTDDQRIAADPQPKP